MSDLPMSSMRHMAWADAVVHEAVRSHHTGVEDPDLRVLLHHVHAVQWVYLHLWRDRPTDVPDVAAFDDLAAVERWGREGHAEILELVAEFEPEALQRTIAFPWRETLERQWGIARTATLEETIAQVASHSAYHRGQINRRLRELGGEPPLTDFVAWIWAGKPEPPR